MLEKINSLFVFPTAKMASEKVTENEPKETKKCKKCLKRIDFKYEKCPYCRYGDFHFDDN
jgi:hypothetical protein